MSLQTHLRIDRKLCGDLVELVPGYAKVRLLTTSQMLADEEGLVHGGFTFGAADFAAMAAINDPYVVLVAAQVEFLAPVVVGDEVVFEARVMKKDGKKGEVHVSAKVGEKEVFRGIFQTYSPTKHILRRD